MSQIAEKKRRVIFRADGNLQIGYGHFIRSLGIAGLINKDFDCICATRSPTEYQKKEVSKTCNQLIELSDSEEHFEDFLNYIINGDIVVLDNYFFNSEYQAKIRNRGCKVIFIDDYNNQNYVCDVLINNIPGYEESSFSKQPYTKLCLGIDYAILRKEFFKRELRLLPRKKNTIFLAFGGADIFNISQKIVEFLFRIDMKFNINLVVGDAYVPQIDLSKYKNLSVYKNIDASEMAQLMATSEISIVPASSLINEVSCIGNKLLAGYFVDNQIMPYKFFCENLLAIGLGDYRHLEFELFRNKFTEAINADHLIDNQRKIYKYQQEGNFKNLFANA